MDSRDLQGLMEAYVKVYAPVDEAVYGGEPKKPEDTRMVVTAADKRGNTPAYQKFKAGHKGYKSADHLGEESVEEGRALGRAGRDDDNNPRGAAVRASSGRGMTMTPARGLGASKPEGDDKKRAAKQAAQAKEDRRAAAKDRAAEGEDRLSKLVRSVQNSSYEPEGEQIDELYKGKHGQSETEYQDSRSPGGKMVSGTSKLSGAAYSYRGVKNTGPNPAGGSEKPKAQGRMTPGQRTELQYRKANLMKKEELDIFDAILEYLVAEGYAATNKEALVIMANMSEEWRESILDEEQLDEISDRKVRGMLRKREAQDVDSGGISAAYMANRRAQQAAARRNVRTGSNVKVDPILSKEEYVDEAKYARENPEKYEREQAKKTSKKEKAMNDPKTGCLLYTSPSPRD